MDPHQAQGSYEVEAATRLSRLGAALVDTLVCLAPLGVIAILLPMALVARSGSLVVGLAALAGLILLAILAAQILLLATHGQTIGKKALGIQMITSNGERPALWRLFFLRWLPFVVTAVVVELVLKVRGIGNLIHLVDVLFILQPTRRCLHDAFADTHVIKA
jgi:uncharacterized RDD family membrane protein YckC